MNRTEKLVHYVPSYILYKKFSTSFARGSKLEPCGKETTIHIHKSQSFPSSELKKKLHEKIKKEQERIKQFRKDFGKVKISEVTVAQLYGGMRGVKGLLCETSALDPEEGIRFRGYSIPECRDLLPKGHCGEEPLPEAIYWLLLTGEIPTESQVQQLSQELADRAKLPDFIKKFLDNLPTNVHPMTQFSSAICLSNTMSKFLAGYNSGMKKTDYWEYTYEDSLDILANLPLIAATIYNNLYRNKAPIGDLDGCKDWSYNYAHMMGQEDHNFIELLRLYLTIHCDHEGGNVSAHTTHLVGSALSDPYLSLSAGINGLAGPLHGLANQEVLVWLQNMQKEIGADASEEKIKEFVWKTLKSGKVVPGYGHAVLRKTDPRYAVQREFALKHLPDDPMFKLVSKIYTVVPPILTELGKVQNPWPNVDAHSGVLLQYYGFIQAKYYTVLFGVSRAMGVLASLVWDRALGLPIERPKSVTSDQLMALANPKQKDPKHKDEKGGKKGKGKCP